MGRFGGATLPGCDSNRGKHLISAFSHRLSCSDSHSLSLPEKKESETRRKTHPDAPSHVTRPLRPFDNYHNPIRSRRQSPQPSSAPRFSAIQQSAPYISHHSRALTLRRHIHFRRSVAPNSEYDSFIPTSLSLCCDQIALWGKFALGLCHWHSPRNQIRLPDA